MRGTGYAVAEIIWWMLAAAVIGGIIGWRLRYWIGGGRSRKEAEAKIEAQRGRYAEISEELGVWKIKGDGLITDLETKTSELDALDGRKTELEDSLTTATKDLAAVQAGAAEFEAEAAANGVEKDAEISRLQGEIAGFTGLESSVADRDARLTELQDRVGDLESELAAASSQLSALQATHAACGVTADGHAGQITALEAKISGLESENNELRAEVAAASAGQISGTDLEALAAAEEDDADSAGQMAMQTSAAAMAVASPALTRFGTAGADHKDDLKVINGIGPKLEGVLNGYGMESWEQLAALSPAEVATVDEALEEFPGRIQRDEWVEQARDLVKRFPDKSGRPDRKTYLNESPS